VAEIIGYIVNSVSISALYALVAIGFTLIFGVGGILNFAHGAFITFGAFMAFFITSPNYLDTNPLLAVVVAGVATAIIGALMYKGIVQKIQDNPVTVAIITLVAGFFLQHMFRVFVSPRNITVGSPAPGQTELPGLATSVQSHFVFTFVLSWVCIGLVFAFINYTKTGKAVLAASMDDKGAALVGIDANRINLIVWITAAALAGIAGMLLAGFQTGSFNMGNNALVLSFAIVILGGLGSIRGSIIGAYIIGFIETAMTSFINAKMTGLASLVLIVLVLLIRPEGLLGREVEI